MIMQSGGISLVVSGEIPIFKSIKINALKFELIPVLETAHRAKQNIGQVFLYGVATG